MPLHLAGLEAFQFLENADGALDLGRGAAVHSVKGPDGIDEAGHGRSCVIALEEGSFDESNEFRIGCPALRDEQSGLIHEGAE